MRKPTPEQQEVLRNTDRIRVVRAVPGSGKTWLVAEIIRKELGNWPVDGCGIAALSFTRVGGEEIRRALGYDLGHPHFVGTIDAFLFRYVVRPFLQYAHPNHAAPRLIPAEWSPKYWRKGPSGAVWEHRGIGGNQAQTYNLFEVCFIDEGGAGPVLAYPRLHRGGIEPVAAKDRARLLRAKRESWRTLGWLTHADAALLASELLSDAMYGPVIKALLLRRFGFVIVDELQDTGFYLGKSIRLLLEDRTSRGVFVGDPDQAIFEFNGARPDLFDEFENLPDTVKYPLAISLRCPVSITTCANHLKDTGGEIDPCTNSTGRAFLVRYDDMAVDMARLVGVIRTARPSARLEAISRQAKSIEELTSRSAKDAKSLHCPTLHHLYRAVKAFRQGYNVRGLANARASIELAVFGHEGITDEELNEQTIDPAEWKALAVRCLLSCNSLPTTENLYDWQVAAGKVLDNTVSGFGLPRSLSFQTGKLKPQRRKGTGWDKQASDFLPTGSVAAPAIAGVPVQTVHAVKGETHDVTVFVCPVSRENRCPSVVWWSNEDSHREERRIAYVAMTRTRGDLVLCVSDACYQRLCTDRPAFINTFECKTVDECIMAYSI